MRSLRLFAQRYPFSRDALYASHFEDDGISRMYLSFVFQAPATPKCQAQERMCRIVYVYLLVFTEKLGNLGKSGKNLIHYPK